MSLVLALSVAYAVDLNVVDHAWPLCGRLTETSTWIDGDPCPVDRIGHPDHHDFPLSATYGPERLSNPSDRYAWHRGIDIPTACGTPVFAMADGRVMLDGVSTAYQSLTVRLRHGDTQRCTDGCVHTEYSHLSEVVVQLDDEVQAGDLIGYSGYFGIGRDPTVDRATKCATMRDDDTDFLHFEVREAPLDDVYSSWSRDAIHPLNLLPYHDLGVNDTRVRFEHVDTRDPLHPTVVVTAQIRNAEELDLDAIVLQAIDRSTQPWSEVPQPGNTPAPDGSLIRPTRIDLQDWNRRWTHKNSTAFPWSSFDDCPYAWLHGTGYDADLHTGALHPRDSRFMQFNGLTMWVRRFDTGTIVWSASVWFEDLVGTARRRDLCLRAWVEDIHGTASTPVTWNCAR